MEGYLEKRSEWRKEWNVRYFALQGAYLKYKPDESSEWKEQRLVHAAPTSVDAAEFAFVVPAAAAATAGSRSEDLHDWHLRAGSKSDFDAWLAAINAVVASAAAAAANSDAAAVPSQQQPDAAVHGRARAQSVAVAVAAASHDIAAAFAAAPAATGSKAAAGSHQQQQQRPFPPYFVGEKRSQHLHQWRLRVFVVAEEDSPVYPPGTLLYAPIDAPTPTPAQLQSALKSPQRLQVVSADIVSPNYPFDDGLSSTVCRVQVSDAKTAAAQAGGTVEEFLVRFAARRTMQSFVSAIWHSLAKPSSVGGLVHVQQRLTSKCVVAATTVTASSSSTSSSSSSAAAMVCALVLGASNGCAGFVHGGAAPSAVVLCGGTQRAPSAASSGFAAALKKSTSNSGLVQSSPTQQQQPEELLAAAFVQPQSQAFAPIDALCVLRLGGEHASELRALPQSPSQQPQVREGAASACLPGNGGVLVMHGGTDGNTVLGGDGIWACNLNAAADGGGGGGGWRQVQLRVDSEKLPPLLGHSLLPIFSALGGSIVAALLGGLDAEQRLQTSVFLIEFDAKVTRAAPRCCADVRLGRGRARHGACVVADTWVVVAGGVAAAGSTAAAAIANVATDSRVVEICHLSKFHLGESDGGAVNDVSFVPAPALLPTLVPNNAAVCAHPSKSEFFVAGAPDGSIFRGVVTLDQTVGDSRLPSLIFYTIQAGGGWGLGGCKIFAAKMFSLLAPEEEHDAVAPDVTARTFLYVFGGGADKIGRVLLD